MVVIFRTKGKRLCLSLPLASLITANDEASENHLHASRIVVRQEEEEEENAPPNRK